MIMRAMEHEIPWERIQTVLDELLVVMRKFDCRRAREILLDTIAEYQPTEEIQDLVWRKHAYEPVPITVVATDDRKVTELATRRAAKASTTAAPQN